MADWFEMQGNDAAYRWLQGKEPVVDHVHLQRFLYMLQKLIQHEEGWVEWVQYNGEDQSMAVVGGVGLVIREVDLLAVNVT